ncbi:hypothetical protein DESA109040_14215 [Deinococcus saxicola]|uniref:hypothetical protein n=1 Tax=Deinococcus saxicola TaxID=249406 RepID=UPI0039F0C28E
MTQPRIFYRPMEIHQEFGIPRDRIYTAINTGELKAANFGTERKRSFFVALVDLDAWITQLKNWRDDSSGKETQ